MMGSPKRRKKSAKYNMPEFTPLFLCQACIEYALKYSKEAAEGFAEIIKASRL